MGFLTKFILIALFPQMTFWIMFTMVVGTLFGGIAAALVRPKVTAEVAQIPEEDVARAPEEAPAPDDDPEKAEDTP